MLCCATLRYTTLRWGVLTEVEEGRKEDGGRIRDEEREEKIVNTDGTWDGALDRDGDGKTKPVMVVCSEG